MDAFGETTGTIIKTEYGQNVSVSQQVSKNSLEKVPHGAVNELKSPEIHIYNRNQGDGFRERHRAKSREKKYNDDRRPYRKDKYRSTEKDRSYDETQSEISRDYSTDKSRGKRHDEREKRSARDKYSSRNRSETYDDYQRKESSNRSREKRCNDSKSSYYSDYSTRDRSRNYENQKTCINTVLIHDIKQEKDLQESEFSTQYTRDRNGDRSNKNEGRHNDYKNKHSWKDRSAERQKGYSPHIVIQERDIGETYRKRQRSRSKERRLKDKKRRHDNEKHSSNRHPSEMVIKQEP